MFTISCAIAVLVAKGNVVNGKVAKKVKTAGIKCSKS